MNKSTLVNCGGIVGGGGTINAIPLNNVLHFGSLYCCFPLNIN
jgi:hypothetical protein